MIEVGDGALSIPVGFFIFNRLDTTKEVFSAIRKAKPERLYLISDGARDSKYGETEKVRAVRHYVEDHIDWPCTVFKDYAKKNMGCRERMASGISWLFDHEEMAIILEDDCKPTQDFFSYVAELLERYKDDERIMYISGSKLLVRYQMEYSYTFSKYAMIWGWATWRRAWEKYDIDIKSWGMIKKTGALRKYYTNLGYIKASREFDSVYEHKNDTWDFQWGYAIIINKGLGIVPCVNMIENLGFGREDATHTTSSARQDFSCGKLDFPLRHPSMVKADKRYDLAFQRYECGIIALIGKIMRRFTGDILGK